MNKLENGQNIEPENSKVSARRKFLVKASVTSLVAALPIRASWAGANGTGCSVSGNLSGNLSRECEVVLSGLSPGAWKNNYASSKKKFNSVASVPEKNTAECKWNYVFTSTRPPFSGPAGDEVELWWFLPNIGIAPYSVGGSSENIDTHLVAAYLNAKSGLYGALTVSPEAYVSGLYDQVAYGEVSANVMKAAIESTYHYSG